VPYLSVNDIELYYETHGDHARERPLVLLPGSLSTIETSFGEVLEPLAASRPVTAVDLRGHGHTPAGSRQLSIAQLADDATKLLDGLHYQSVDLFGYSMGAAVALELALSRPDVIGKLVLASVCYDRDGFAPGVLEGIGDLDVASLDGSPWQRAYLAVAPNPAGWRSLVAAIISMDRAFTGWPEDAIRSLSTPTLIINGDADIVTPEHAVAMYRLLPPGSQLAILPGTAHEELPGRAELLVPIVAGFLGAA
jgi:pimeloyl-ACP methyl ester carboxylesterase